MQEPGCQPATSVKIFKGPLLVTTAALAFGVSANWLAAAEPVASVSITGAQFIAQDQILAACPVETGARLGTADLRATEACLMETGAFKTATARVEGDQLQLEVVELNDRPGRLEFGIGYDSAQGLYGSALYERYNLLPGVFGGLELRLGKDLQAAKSYLFAKEALGGLDLGLDIGLSKAKGSDYGFTHRRLTFEPYVARDLAEGLRGELGIGYRRDQMSRTEPGASAIFRAEEGLIEQPYLRLGLEYKPNTAEDAWLKTALSVDYHLWGLGKSDRVASLTAQSETRIALDDTYSLGLRLGGGIVRGQNGTATRTTDRFMLGGSELRGFAHRGIGPSDGGWRIGGEKFFVASVGVDRKIGSVLGAPASVGLFADMGSVWGYKAAPVLGDRAWRSSVGASLTVDLGGVPVSAYVAKPIRKENGDKTQYFGLSVEFLR